MSVQIIGDGAQISSIAFTTIVLPSPALTPTIGEDNVDVIEGDGGWTVSYEKGTYRRIFPYRFTLLSATQKDALWQWWELIKGRLHWFTILPHEYPLVVDQIQQAYVGGSDYIIQNSQLNQASNFWQGWWVLVRNGAAQGQKRKIYQSGSNLVYVSPVFDNPVAVNDYVTLGYPVMLDESRFSLSPRLPNWWDVDLVFREKVMG